MPLNKWVIAVTILYMPPPGTLLNQASLHVAVLEFMILAWKCFTKIARIHWNFIISLNNHSDFLALKIFSHIKAYLLSDRLILVLLDILVSLWKASIGQYNEKSTFCGKIIESRANNYILLSSLILTDANLATQQLTLGYILRISCKDRSLSESGTSRVGQDAILNQQYGYGPWC